MSPRARVLLACLCSLGTVGGAGLGIGARELRAQAASPAAKPLEVPKAGDTVPSFDAEGLDGVMKHVAYPKGSGTVLLFFLSSCPTCHRMIPEWNKAYERRPKGLQVMGILMDREPPGFFMATPLSFPILRSPGKDFLGSFHVQRAPVTLRIGPGGKVEDVGAGVLDPIRLGELFRP